jgi:hypothetical protein
MPLSSDLAGYLQRADTLPATGFDGRLWLHTPAGRAWQRLYHGTSWYGQFGYGPATLHVDPAGTDDPDHGWGPGAAAYRTIAYVLDQVPPLLFGAVTVNLGAGTYRELVTIRGKYFTGDYSLTLKSAVTVDYSNTAPTAAANGAGSGSAGYGTLTKTGANLGVNGHRDKFLEITAGTGAGQLRVIHANTADTWTIAGRWATVPDGTSAFRVRSPASRITGANAGAETTAVRANAVRVLGGQPAVVLDGLRLDYGSAVAVEVAGAGSACTLRGCQVAGGVYNVNVQDYAVCTLESCALGPATTNLLLQRGGVVPEALRCRLSGSLNGNALYCVTGALLARLAESYIGGATYYGLSARFFGTAVLHGYVEVDACGASAVNADHGGLVVTDFDYGGAATNRMLNNNGWGATATPAGTITGCSGWTYSGNTAGTRTPTTLTGGGTD